jgi:hypothetical protein
VGTPTNYQQQVKPKHLHRKPPLKKREETFKVRASAEELQKLESEAQRQGVTLSELVRNIPTLLSVNVPKNDIIIWIVRTDRLLAEVLETLRVTQTSTPETKKKIEEGLAALLTTLEKITKNFRHDL